jgi:site-specific recombinase XerD
LITAFLDHLEKHQRLSTRSRNLRLTALRSFFRFAAFEAPAHSAQIQRVLAIPSKRFTRTLVQFLTRAEVDALLPLRISVHGLAGVITPSSCWQFRQVCAYPR